jgi:predicted nucleic acid-binding protein
MRTIFADTFYWTALLNSKDEWHQRVRAFNRTFGSVQLVTTDEVLTEYLNFFSAFEPYIKEGASERVAEIQQDDRVTVIPQAHTTFLAGLQLYCQRTDKGYSLTDCISMQTMKRLKMTEVLTHDRHFLQEGFIILFE